MEELEFNQRLCDRLTELRLEKGWTQLQMANALRIPLDRYKKYEIRSPLPSYLFSRLAAVMAKPVDYIVTGTAVRTPPRARPLRRSRNASS